MSKTRIGRKRGCFATKTLVLFAQGRLNEVRDKNVRRHIQKCERCAKIVSTELNTVTELNIAELHADISRQVEEAEPQHCTVVKGGVAVLSDSAWGKIVADAVNGNGA